MTIKLLTPSAEVWGFSLKKQKLKNVWFLAIKNWKLFGHKPKLFGVFGFVLGFCQTP